MSLARTKQAATVPNDLASFWVPFTPNRAFKKAPRLIVRAKDMHYYTVDGKAVLDGSAGMWCCNAGHNRSSIVQAIQDQAAELDYPPAFQFSHPKAFELASRIAALAPDQAHARGLAAHVVVGERDLQCGIDGFRAGIAEEHMVEPGGRQIGDAAGELEGLGNAELERRGVIQRLGLLADRG